MCAKLIARVFDQNRESGLVREWSFAPSVGSTESAGVGEPSQAARALAVTPSQDRRERTRLRQGHDRPERQRSPVGVVAIRDPAD